MINRIFGIDGRFAGLALSAILIILMAAWSAGIPDGKSDPAVRLMEKYRDDVREFQEALSALRDPQLSNAETQFIECRTAFKRIEFLLEYTDRSRHVLFNGAPVSREDHSTPAYNTLPPQGLQVLEEMLCASVPDTSAFLEAVGELTFQAGLWSDFVESLSPQPADWMRAALIHLIRIETLSLAAFDRPCIDKEAVSDLQVSFNAIQSVVLAVRPGLASPMFEKIDSVLSSFDRLEDIPMAAFIRGQIQPLRGALAALLASLPDHSELPPQPFNTGVASLYDPEFLDASWYSEYGMSPNDAELVKEKEKLGRALFFEPLLSEAGPMSCGTCHRKNLYFTDGQALSSSNRPGIPLTRNTPTLVHAGYQAAYMFDARSSSLEDQVLHVFNNEMEFRTSIGRITERLSADKNYRYDFERLYPEMAPDAINLHSVTDALASYVRSLTGHDSAFDRYMRGQSDALTAEARDGFRLFMTKAKCGTCHFAPTFSGLAPPFFTESELENIGVPAVDAEGTWSVDPDAGRFVFYENSAFRHFFKTTTVRNAGMTAPYMHNGSMKDLSEVIDLYERGGGAGAGLDYPNQTLGSDSLGLTPLEAGQIIAFIHSLTDSTYLVSASAY